MSKKINEIILANFILNEKFTRKIIPHFKTEYFSEEVDKLVFDEIDNFVNSFNTLPTKEALIISIENKPEIGVDISNRAISFISDIEEGYESPNFDWLVKTSEKFCKDAAVVNALMTSIKIIDGDDKEFSKDAIPGILSNALAVTFDSHIGLDCLDDAEAWYDEYIKVEDRLPFDIEILNKITRNGLPGKSLTVFLGGTGTGKTNILCHFAASYARDGKNVLYITLELDEHKITERLNANLLSVNINDLIKLGKEAFMTRINKLKEKTLGKIIVKEYPMRSAHAGHFKALVEELKIKKNFKPDVILVDYLGICSSARYRDGSRGINTNTFFQSVAEELRGMAQFYNVPVITAIQTNRSGSTNSDIDMTDSADSFGIAMTADLFLGVVTNDDLANLNQLMLFVLKNRYNDLNYYKRFLVGVERAKMMLYDLESSVNEKDVMKVAEQVREEVFTSKKETNKHDFSGFKI